VHEIVSAQSTYVTIGGRDYGSCANGVIGGSHNGGGNCITSNCAGILLTSGTRMNPPPNNEVVTFNVMVLNNNSTISNPIGGIQNAGGNLCDGTSYYDFNQYFFPNDPNALTQSNWEWCNGAGNGFALFTWAGWLSATPPVPGQDPHGRATP
jgi:hypothetical protein